MEESMMSQQVTSVSFKFQSPPVKMLAGPLSHCSRSSEGQCPFLLKNSEDGSELDVSVVWMQGTILEVLPEHGITVRIEDETGTFLASGISSVPAGKPCVFAGKYVMVMGVVQSCNPEPFLQAVKMTDLSDNPVHRSMWILEVEDLHRSLRLI